MKTFSNSHRLSILPCGRHSLRGLAAVVRRLSTLAFASLTSFVLPAAGAPGDVEAGFNPNAGNGSGTVRSLVLQSDGKLIIGGSFYSVNGVPSSNVARLESDGTVNTTFSSGVNDYVAGAAVQADGRIVVVGWFSSPRSRIARFLPNGTLDPGFDPGGSGYGFSVAMQADGKIIVAGEFTTVGGVARNRLARLNPDGSVDTVFNPNANNTVASTAVQEDGKIIIGGSFTTVVGAARNRIARVNEDGTLDTAFNPNANNSVETMAIQADGKILIGGSFTAVAGVPRNLVARLNADGSLDTGFDPNVRDGLDPAVFSITGQTDGRILIGGRFLTVGGLARRNIARLNTNGTLDAGFNPDANGTVLGMMLQADGRILIGGAFTTLGGVTRNGIARLQNDAATQSLTVAGAGRVQWLREGASPETQQVSFEISTDGGTVWNPLGPGTRIAGGWERAGLSLPAAGRIRARARVTGGIYGGSSSLMEATTPFSFGPPGPEIVVEQPLNASLTDGGSKDFGTILVSSGATVTFTIRNIGSADLTGLTITTDGADAPMFTVTANPTTPVNGYGHSTAFTARFAPDSTGMKTAALHIASNDADENPFDIILTGTGATAFAPSASTEAATSVLSRAATLHGTVNANGASTAVSFDYGLTASYGLNVSGTPTPVTGSSATAVSADLTGLSPATTYHYRVRGTNSLGATLGADLTFNTSVDFPSYPAPGTLDSSFGNNGRVSGSYTSVTLQTDGKIVAAGGSWITRFNANGSPDASFGASGTGVVSAGMSLSPFDRAVAVQNDGKVVAVGTISNDLGVVRFNANGTLDTSFGGTGRVITNITMGSYRIGTTYYTEPSRDTGAGVAVQGDGKIVATGTAIYKNGDIFDVAMRVIRYNTDGTGDTSFPLHVLAAGNSLYGGYPDSGGQATSIALQPDQKIVAAGWSIYGGFSIDRYNAGGSEEVHYNGPRPIPEQFPNPDKCYGVAVKADGTIFATGSVVTGGGLVGYGSGRIVLGPVGQPGRSVAVQPDGRIVVAGSSLLRYNADGTLDSSVRPASGGNSVVLQSDGKILVAGGSLSRYEGGTVWIGIEQPAGTPLLDGAGSTDFGSLNVGVSVLRTFTIRNTGTSTVTGLQIGKNGSHAGDFTPSTPVTTTLIAGASTTFTVAFNPTASGTRTAAIHITGAGIDEDPFDVMLTGNGTLPDIAVEQPAGSGLVDGTATVAFGTRNVGLPAPVLTFTVRNDGAGPLTGLALDKDGANNADFRISGPGTTTLAPAATTTFTVTFVPSAAGPRTAALHLASNDPDENPFDVTLTGSGVMPKIAVEQPAGSALTDSSATAVNFGIIAAGSSASRTFTIRNVGTSDVTGLAVTKAADGNPGDFIIDTPGAVTLGAGGTTTFTVTFSPTAPGVRSAKLQIASNGGDETPFSINLTGTQVTPNEAWRQTYFGSTANTGAGADLSDPDRDGAVNLLEYATATDPLKSTPFPGKMVKNGNNLEFTYTRRKAAVAEMTFVREFSETLAGTWSTVAGTVETILSDDGALQQVKTTVPAGSTGKRFVRLRVTRL